MSGNQLILRALVKESSRPFSHLSRSLSSLFGGIIKINQLALGVASAGRAEQIDVSLSGSLCRSIADPLTLFLPPSNEISYHCA